VICYRLRCLLKQGRLYFNPMVDWINGPDLFIHCIYNYVFQDDFHIRWRSCRLTVTRRVSNVEQELLTLPEQQMSLTVFPFPFCQCVVCPSSIYDFWFPLWYLQAFRSVYLGLWKESLNSDGQRFNQYQQNEQPPLTVIHWTQRKTKTYAEENAGPGVWQAQICGRVILVDIISIILHFL
jgi:hypothetical protein